MSHSRHNGPLLPLADALARFNELEKLGRLPSEDAWRAMLDAEAAVRAALTLADGRTFSRGNNSSLAGAAKSGVAGLDRAAKVMAQAAGHALPEGVAGMLGRTGAQIARALGGDAPAEARLAALGMGYVKVSAAGLVPPGDSDAAPATGSGEGWEKQRTEPRLRIVFEALREIGLFPEDAHALVSAAIPGAVRTLPYVRLWFPRAGFSLLVNEQVGEALFYVPCLLTEGDCAALGKEKIMALPGAVRIVWAGNWKDALLAAVRGNLPEKKLRPKAAVTAASALPMAAEANGWMVDALWPDGKTEPGRAVTGTMPDIHGAKGFTVLAHLAAWEKSGTPRQKAWLAGNVKFDGARGENGSPVTLVRESELEGFAKGTLPCSDPCEANGWTTLLDWPDGNGGTFEERGRIVTQKMPGVHGMQGQTVLKCLAAWEQSGTDAQKKWLAENVRKEGAKITGKPVTVVRASALKKLCEEELGGGLPDATEANGWMVDALWPDGKTEPGRVVTQTMPDVHGARGKAVLRRLAAWEKSGTPRQKAWLAENVRKEGAKITGKPVTVVRESALEWLCRKELGGGLPDATEANGWMVDALWPDGKTEPGRAVTRTMPDIHGAKGFTVLAHLAAWEKSGTPRQKAWLAGNVKFDGARGENGSPVTLVRESELEGFAKGTLPCSDPCEANGWTTLLDWPDGNGGTFEERGRTVTNTMPDVHGARGKTVLRRLAAWEQSGTDAQKKWLAENVRKEGAKTGAGWSGTVVRESELAWFNAQF